MKQLSKEEIRRLTVKHSKGELQRPHDHVCLSVTDNCIYYEIGTNYDSSPGSESYNYYYNWNEGQRCGSRKILDDDMFTVIQKFFELGIKTEKARISQILDLG
jgi:hypothetical protein